jgi:hypothetical protein
VIDDDIERRLSQGIRDRDAEQLAIEIEQADLDAEKKRITEEELKFIYQENLGFSLSYLESCCSY